MNTINSNEVANIENDIFGNTENMLPKNDITKTDDEINEKYLKGEIRIVTEQARYPLNTIKDMFSTDDYDLYPDFQRRNRWNRNQQSKLIESFIINVPIPPIFLYEKDYSIYEVMDGLQRITAIKEFYENKYALEGLEMWPELNGKIYSELPDQIRKGIDRRYISSIILLKETAKDQETANYLKQLVFSRINSGGAKLEDQEYRNALHPGKFNSLIIDLAKNPQFCEIFEIPIQDTSEDKDEDENLRNNSRYNTMKDVETVLRFYAMRKIDMWNNGTLSKFLTFFLERANNLPQNVIDYYRELFEKTIKLAFNIYGENTFAMWKKRNNESEYKWTKKPIISVYDPLMVVLSEKIEKADFLVSKKDEIVEGTKKLFQENNTLLSGRNTSSSNVKERMNIFRSYFNSL